MLQKKLKPCKTCNKDSQIFSRGNCKLCAAKAALLVKKATPKKKLVTLAKLKKEARYWFQRWIRLRDLNNTCCYGSNNRLEDIKTYDACHYLKFELYPEAGFDEDNVHGGSKGENIRDNTIAYRRELIRRKGEKWVKNLEDRYCIDRTTQYKWDREFLESIITEYKARCKELENSK
jgi:hypothetical protein